MSKEAFRTNPVSLEALLRQCGDGKIQLPDFQRSWVWAEDRILSLIASVSCAFPIGALMTLESNSGATIFARRPVQGAHSGANDISPTELLLDGQQRMTSLYQSCMRREVVETITPKNKLVRRWFYIDIMKSLAVGADRDDAIFTVPEDRRIKTNFDKDILLDLAESVREYEQLMFPLNRVFDWDEWQESFGDHWIAKGDAPKRDVFKRFKNEVLNNFKSYHVPVITLAHDTSHEAVCLVFEKVNTGGKPLDAFELLTAMYAARGHKLRDDWLGADGKKGLQTRLAEFGRAADQSVGVLAKVASTDVLQAIALLFTKRVRAEKEAAGVSEHDLPAVRATRQSLLDLPLEEYLRYRDAVENGFKRAAKFLRQQCIHRVLDLPYQTQLVSLAAIFAEMGEAAEHAGQLAKIARWYWCGIFGELYGGAVESRFAKDVVEVPAWLAGGPEPTTVRDGVFRADRLLTMRTRLSAAYKGIHALLMREGAQDFRTGQGYDLTVFFDEGVDIHHIFPQDWCEKRKINEKIYDSVINKTPLSYRTNRIIGGIAPSEYLAKLELGKKNAKGQIENPPIPAAMLDGYLVSHCISPQFLRADDFESFMKHRRQALLNLISKNTGHSIVEGAPTVDEGEEVSEDIARDSGLLVGTV
ncbi:MAG: DUF262 domain-containing protein [Phycisphaerales bacterium]|nr:DUF262 domain-containing protein [Phycisphaerales bacterium]